MAVIKLYGDLKQHGDKFKINANTASEALSALYYQISGFRQKIVSGLNTQIQSGDIEHGNR